MKLRTLGATAAGLLAALTLVASPASASTKVESKQANVKTHVLSNASAKILLDGGSKQPTKSKGPIAHAAWTGTCIDYYPGLLWYYTGITAAQIRTCNMLRSNTAQIYTNGGRRFQITVSFDGNSVTIAEIF